MLKTEEIENLENAINASIKQVGLLLLMASIMQAQTVGGQSVITVEEILHTASVYSDALETVKKLKKGSE